ncbi:MAG: DUF4115 domain-containing protein [Alcanivoracaceae bacterium]|nr:DUF4115 domain-containing protein [Alcanivoracaceae bacterium]
MNHSLLPGQRLKAAREQSGLSEREVGERLRLSTSYVKALESDDYERLPGSAFIKGYMRNYAKLVGLPADDIANLYSQMRAEEPSRETESSAAEVDSTSDSQPLKPWMIWASAALVLVVVVAFFASTGTNGEVAGEQEQVEQEQTIDAPEDIEAVQSVSEGDLDEGGVIDDGAADLSTDASPERIIAREPEEDITPPAQDRLQVSFVDVCWIKVSDSTGADIYTGQRNAGGRLILEGEAPFRITLGNAAAVEQIQMNDQTIPVPAATPGRVVVVRTP